MIEVEVLHPRLAALRREFDAAFAEPDAIADHEFVNLISIGVANQALLVELTQLAGLYADRVIMPVPSAMPSLLGVCDFRGELVAAYDLCSVLGYARAESCRFLLRVAQRPLGFAFDRVLGYARIPRAALVQTVADGFAWAPRQAQFAGKTQPIVDLTALSAKLEQQVAFTQARET